MNAPLHRPLPLFPDKAVTLPPRYFGSVGYFALLAAYGTAVIQDDALYDKRQKEVHRCTVADTHGPVTLTVPVSKPHGIPRATWREVGISDHGAWWHVHRVTLESAYGRTPFFEFYIDSLLPYLSASTPGAFPSVAALDTALTARVASLLQLPTRILTASEAPQTPQTTRLTDGTEYPLAQSDPTCADPSMVSRLADLATWPPYYQVRQDTQGFQPGLSILDLLFNLGPEAPLYLLRLLEG